MNPRQFEETFPQLEHAFIAHYEVGDGIHKNLPAKEYTSPLAIKDLLMRCSNPRCTRGGYEIGDEISRTLMRNELESETVLFCAGDEGSPRGEKGLGCMNNIHIQLKLRYKS